jgi:hypothetical protein
MIAGLLCDVGYIRKQIEHAKRRQYTGQGCMDELARITDALDRIEQQLTAEAQAQEPDAAPEGWQHV